jgi:CheY-like chemotaxis protein
MADGGAHETDYSFTRSDHGDAAKPRQQNAEQPYHRPTAQRLDSLFGSEAPEPVQGKAVGLMGERATAMGARADFTVLVVEDEWLLRMELAEELGEAGWRVMEAASGEDALRKLASAGKVDFLVTDIRLAGAVNGWDVAEAARRRDPCLPVIYVSANPVDESHRVLDSLFLGKPVDVRQLLEACDRLVLDSN